MPHAPRIVTVAVQIVSYSLIVGLVGRYVLRASSFRNLAVTNATAMTVYLSLEALSRKSNGH